jgi:hypothetical protein
MVVLRAAGLSDGRIGEGETETPPRRFSRGESTKQLHARGLRSFTGDDDDSDNDSDDEVLQMDCWLVCGLRLATCAWRLRLATGDLATGNLDLLVNNDSRDGLDHARLLPLDYRWIHEPVRSPRVRDERDEAPSNHENPLAASAAAKNNATFPSLRRGRGGRAGLSKSPACERRRGVIFLLLFVLALLAWARALGLALGWLGPCLALVSYARTRS